MKDSLKPKKLDPKKHFNLNVDSKKDSDKLVSEMKKKLEVETLEFWETNGLSKSGMVKTDWYVGRIITVLEDMNNRLKKLEEKDKI